EHGVVRQHRIEPRVERDVRAIGREIVLEIGERHALPADRGARAERPQRALAPGPEPLSIVVFLERGVLPALNGAAELDAAERPGHEPAIQLDAGALET